MSKPDFNQVGDVSDKVTWNTAGTRKWRMTYTLLEVKPSWRSQGKSQATEKDSEEGGYKEKEPTLESKKDTKARSGKNTKKNSKVGTLAKSKKSKEK